MVHRRAASSAAGETGRSPGSAEIRAGAYVLRFDFVLTRFLHLGTTGIGLKRLRSQCRKATHDMVVSWHGQVVSRLQIRCGQKIAHVRIVLEAILE